jgi:hypothetical protein
MLVDEEAAVWEVAATSTIVTTDEATQDGPHDLATCSRVLLAWLADGLIGICDDSPSHAELAPERAYLALERFEAWRPGEVSAHLFATAKGGRASDDEWNVGT